jgi:hypothetical protein
LLLNWTGSIRHDLYVHKQSTDLYYWNQLYIDEHIHVLCYLSEPELVVYWCPTKCHLLLNWTKSIRNDLYVHTHQIIKSGAYDEKNNVFVQNQVIKYRFKMIRLHDTVIVLDIVITNWE